MAKQIKAYTLSIEIPDGATTGTATVIYTVNDTVETDLERMNDVAVVVNDSDTLTQIKAAAIVAINAAEGI